MLLPSSYEPWTWGAMSVQSLVGLATSDLSINILVYMMFNAERPMGRIQD